MLEKIILPYNKGISSSPSDILCSDGELADCVNLEVKNGELVPMEMPTSLGITMEPGEILVLVHNMKTQGKNFFSIKNGILRAFAIEGFSKVYYNELSVDLGVLKSIQAVGNTVIAYSDKSPHYILYTEGLYKYLGPSLPELNLSFNLKGTMVVSELFDVDVPKVRNTEPGDPDLSSDENIEKVTDQIIPKVNKFISEEADDKGLFIFPFFVRYAYRLFDGTYTRQSPPVLLTPSTTVAPICGYKARQEGRPPFETFIAAVPSKIQVRKDSNIKLNDWTDVISEIVIFVSSPIRTYDQEGRIEGISKHVYSSAHRSEFVGELAGSVKKHNIHDNMSLSENDPGSNVLWNLPIKDSGDIAAEISGCSLFYRYISYLPSFVEENVLWTIEPESSGVNPVSGIEVQETLPDDYMSHDTLIPESSFVYNSRLNISNIQRVLFKGFPPATLVQPATNGTNLGFYIVYVYIKTQDGTAIVKSPSSLFSFDMYGFYLFYPDTDAYRMVIHDTYLGRYADIPLSEHSGLNGAFYFSGFNDISFISGKPNISESDIYAEHLPNKLFTSEVNNPFRFPLAGINTVGTGKIIGIAAVTRPISQGQFGEYPLIAFCSDGNFALKVDSEGFYSGISPVQEDVVLGGDKITPMEDSVAVVTKKGVMLTTGGVMTRVAAQLDGGMFLMDSLDGIKTSFQEFSSLVEAASDNEGFVSYVYSSRMAFDYASNRLLVYKDNKPYSYIISMENGMVTKMSLKGNSIVASVLDYPDTILQDSEGKLYSLYDKVDVSTLDKKMYGILVTRPLKMNEAMTMKSIRQLKTIGACFSKDSYIKYLLYGSNDNTTYYKVGSRFGKPYKYYRLVVYTCLIPKESVSGTALTIEKRRTSKLR